MVLRKKARYEMTLLPLSKFFILTYFFFGSMNFPPFLVSVSSLLKRTAEMISKDDSPDEDAPPVKLRKVESEELASLKHDPCLAILLFRL